MDSVAGASDEERLGQVSSAPRVDEKLIDQNVLVETQFLPIVATVARDIDAIGAIWRSFVPSCADIERLGMDRIDCQTSGRDIYVILDEGVEDGFPRSASVPRAERRAPSPPGT